MKKKCKECKTSLIRVGRKNNYTEVNLAIADNLAMKLKVPPFTPFTGSRSNISQATII